MHEDLMDQGVAEPNLARARAAVKRNRGAAGIDRMTVDELEVHWQRHGAKMRAKLVAGRWTPSPVRRVDIPKPNGGTRQLGIPTVMDRGVQQALLQVLQPIFDPSVVRQADCTLCRAARPRLTFSRMSEAVAVQMKVVGCSLCWAM